MKPSKLKQYKIKIKQMIRLWKNRYNDTFMRGGSFQEMSNAKTDSNGSQER